MRSETESSDANRNSTYSHTLEQGLSIDSIRQVHKRRTHRSYRRHRSREEIIANILAAARKNATKTRIMHRAYISYNLLQKYLSRASVSGLLLYDHRSNQYQITSKGMQYLDYFNQYRDTESDLVLKKSMISKMLENDKEESVSLTWKMEGKACC